MPANHGGCHVIVNQAETGTAREVVSRKLKCFESDALIPSSRGRVEIVDRENLRALSGTTDP